jgi:hypothetical protein
MIPDAASKTITDYIVALAGMDRARATAEKAKKEEEAQCQAVIKAMNDLAAAVGYKKGDPPMSVKIPGEDKVIRLYTYEYDRCGRSGRDEREIRATIERFA